MFFRYDGEYFLSDIKEVTKRMKSKSKKLKQMRYYFYMKWAIELRKAAFDIEKDNDNPCYTYPKIILNVLREIAPGNIIGEIGVVYIFFTNFIVHLPKQYNICFSSVFLKKVFLF